jgi:hypothetical protein
VDPAGRNRFPVPALPVPAAVAVTGSETVHSGPMEPRRLSLRDRGWLGHEVLRVIGPLSGLSVARLREALVRLHRADPLRPALSRLDRVARHWVPLPSEEFAGWVRDLVLDCSPAAPATYGLAGLAGSDTDGDLAGLRRYLLAHPMGDRPLLLGVRGDVLGMRLSHAAGDGRTASALLMELLLPGPVRRTTTGRHAFLRAAGRHFGRYPGRALGALSHGRPPYLGLSSGGPDHSWAPDQACRYAYSPAGLVAELTRYRDRRLPGVSMAALLSAALPVALTRVGLHSARPGLTVLVDTRRFLPGSVPVEGNFTHAQYLRPADPTDPRAVDAVLRAELHSGRPLARLRDARALLPGGSPGRRAVPAPAVPRPELTVAHLNRFDPDGLLSWLGDGRHRRFASAPDPASPAAVSVSFTELDGVLHASAGFHGSTFRPELVGAALDLLVTDPVGLLGGAPR